MNATDTDDVNDNGLDLDQDTSNGFAVGLRVVVVCLNHSWELFAFDTILLMAWNCSCPIKTVWVRYKRLFWKAIAENRWDKFSKIWLMKIGAFQ